MDIKLDFKDLNILCVDDDKEIIQSYKNLFRNLFNKVFISTNPLKAIEIFKKTKIDLVITDYLMPQMNGIEFSKEIRKIDPQIPIILITAFNEYHILKEALENNITYFLTKPFSIKILLNVLDKIKKEIIATKYLLKAQKEYIEYVDYQQNLTLKKQLTILEDESTTKKNRYFDINVFFKPKDILSGDSYLVKIYDEKIIIFIADGMGKGISASFTSLISTAFIKFCLKEYSFKETISKYQKFIKENLLEEETISFSFLEIFKNKINYAICGMPATLIKQNENIIKIKSNNPPFSKWLNEINISIFEDNFDEILTFSDGLSELYINENKLFLTVLKNYLKEYKHFSSFLRNIDDIILNQQDDITIIHLRRKNGN